jgi:hypothetical protein
MLVLLIAPEADYNPRNATRVEPKMCRLCGRAVALKSRSICCGLGQGCALEANHHRRHVSELGSLLLDTTVIAVPGHDWYTRPCLVLEWY